MLGGKGLYAVDPHVKHAGGEERNIPSAPILSVHCVPARSVASSH